MKKAIVLALGFSLTVANVLAETVTTPFPNRVAICSEHWGWATRSTNLTLTLTNGLFSAGAYSVSSALVSNVLAVSKRPWPAPASNSWPRFWIDTENLGLTPSWLKTNYELLLKSYSEKDGPAFPNVSERQRAWLTNALADISLLGEAIRGSFGSFWTDDYPSLELRFEHDDGQVLEQVCRLKTTAQPAFMLPWELLDGTNQFISGNADISRAVVQILPPGFLNRDRMNGDLLRMVSSGFLNTERVYGYLTRSTLEQTIGDETFLFSQGFELRNSSVYGNSTRFPETFRGTLYRTNWPERISVPLQTRVEMGIAGNLKGMVTNAQTRVAPLLKQEWLMSRLTGSTNLSVEVKTEGSPDHQWLRGHMEKEGLGAFYDRIAPDLRRSLGFGLREGFKRASEWALLEDGRLLLYGFTGEGVLNWSPEELGFQGDRRALQSSTINRVGVFVGSAGRITEKAVPQK